MGDKPLDVRKSNWSLCVPDAGTACRENDGWWYGGRRSGSRLMGMGRKEEKLKVAGRDREAKKKKKGVLLESEISIN